MIKPRPLRRIALPEIDSFHVHLGMGIGLCHASPEVRAQFAGMEEREVLSRRVRMYDVRIKDAEFVNTLHAKTEPVAHAHVWRLIELCREEPGSIFSKRKPNGILVFNKFFARVWLVFSWDKKDREWIRSVLPVPLAVTSPYRLIVR